MQEFFSTFGFIFTTVILPIFLQICVGFGIQKIFHFDLRTLSKIQFYVFIPALMFSKIYGGNVEGTTAVQVIISTILIYLGMLVLGFAVAFLFRFKKSMRNAFANTVSMYNSGNYCIPLMELLYQGDPFVMSVQAIIMSVQNVITSTLGAITASSGQAGFGKALKSALAIPMLYVAILAAALKGFGVVVWEPILSTVDMMSDCLVPIALFTLGAQLAETKINFADYKIHLANFIKLCCAPLLALGVVMLMGIDGIVAQVTVIVSAAPTAVNVLILAMEYKNEVDFTSQTVFLSTVLSSVTVTAVIYFALNFIG